MPLAPGLDRPRRLRRAAPHRRSHRRPDLQRPRARAARQLRRLHTVSVAEDLTAAVERGCAVDVVFETHEDSSGDYSGPSIAFGAVPGIRRWRWPADRRPSGGAALHAKLLVVDGRRALVGSANLTHRALTANLEAGVLIEDPDVAAQLERHVRRLMRDEVLASA